jgi:hypothetical protein
MAWAIIIYRVIKLQSFGISGREFHFREFIIPNSAA